MMTKVLHVNQQHKLHGVDDDKGTSCKSTTQLHGVDDDILHVNQQHKLWCR